MSINKEVLSALAGVGVPVTFHTYSGKADPYITFFTYLEKSEQHADDAEIITGHYVQLDIWTKGDYIELVKAVHDRMKQAGFRKINFYDLYEKDTTVYHKVMRYVIDREESK